MDFQSEYRKRLTSLEEAVSVVRSGSRIYISGNAASPFTMARALADRRDELRDVEIVHVLLLGDDPLAKDDMEGHFRHNSLFVGPADRQAVNEGRADYTPVFLYEIPGLFRAGILDLDVAFLHLSPPDNNGYMSLGVECMTSKAAAESAKMVIVEVNDKMPRVLGDCFVHVSQVDKIVEISRDLPELPSSDPSDIETEIGRHIGDLVEDGSTIQLGIGGISSAALRAMAGKRDLGVHTEMVSDEIVKAIHQGIITGKRKTLHPNKVIATFMFGSREVYTFAHDNPVFELHPVDYTNHPAVIAKNDKMVAINSAIEVDLTGQVCSDSIGARIYSGFGGQVDFIRGAAQSKGGKPIIALPATAKEGSLSRIVPFLSPGAGVVTTRADVHYVVTEHGVADLHGKSLRDRALALIGIADPRFRDDLERSAKERKLI
jgi:acyl-CoA hydrolase